MLLGDRDEKCLMIFKMLLGSFEGAVLLPAASQVKILE